MHGAQRVTQPLSAAEYDARAEKVGKYTKAADVFLQHRKESQQLLQQLQLLAHNHLTQLHHHSDNSTSNTDTGTASAINYADILNLKEEEAIKLRKQLETLYEFDDKLTARLIEINPDFYTLWNHRREIFLYSWEKIAHDVTQQELQSNPTVSASALSELIRKHRTELCSSNLSLAEKGARRNVKCYAVWNYRLWILKHNHSSFAYEIGLCSKFLSMDPRNFHAWNYRRAIMQLANLSPAEELKYTTKMIELNFSNYSAWHYRSKLLNRLYPAEIPDHILDEEFLLVKNAFIDPYDQSGWLYHRWLLGRVIANGPSLPSVANLLVMGDENKLEAKQFEDETTRQKAREHQRAVFERELSLCRELEEIEAESTSNSMDLKPSQSRCKWIVLTTALLLSALLAIDDENQSEKNTETILEQSNIQVSRRKEIEQLFAELQRIDPLRRKYYVDVQSTLRLI